MRTINVLPSREVVESLARPWQSTKIPQGFCPSTRTTACSGKTAACLILLNASIESWERSRKNCGNSDGNADNFQRSSYRTRSLALLHLRAERRMRQVWRATIGCKTNMNHVAGETSSTRKVMTEYVHADCHVGPFHFGSETQRLQHSSQTRRPRLAGKLATLPSIGRPVSSQMKAVLFPCEDANNGVHAPGNKEERLADLSCQPLDNFQYDLVTGARETRRGSLRPNRVLRSRAEPPDRVPHSRVRRSRDR